MPIVSFSHRATRKGLPLSARKTALYLETGEAEQLEETGKAEQEVETGESELPEDISRHAAIRNG